MSLTLNNRDFRISLFFLEHFREGEATDYVQIIRVALVGIFG
jgi:hypothetical protein